MSLQPVNRRDGGHRATRRWLRVVGWAAAWLVPLAALLAGGPGSLRREGRPSETGLGHDEPAAFEVHYASEPYALRGWVLRPAGPGPFPAVVYNHGSERQPSFDGGSELGRWFRDRGYVVFFPYRRGAGGSGGPYWQDEVQKHPPEEREEARIEQLDAQGDDVAAALRWLTAQAYVDAARVAVAGCSFGGIETMLAVERSADWYAAVDFAGAAMSWANSPRLQERLRQAARGAKAPVFFAQAQNDYDTAPSLALAEEMRAARLPHNVRIYPPQGTTPREGHAGFCLRGMASWGEDVLRFLHEAERPRGGRSASP
jgi:carboxymethylenebutenolidase